MRVSRPSELSSSISSVTSALTSYRSGSPVGAVRTLEGTVVALAFSVVRMRKERGRRLGFRRCSNAPGRGLTTQKGKAYLGVQARSSNAERRALPMSRHEVVITCFSNQSRVVQDSFCELSSSVSSVTSALTSYQSGLPIGVVRTRKERGRRLGFLRRSGAV